MDQASASIALIKEHPGFLASRRRILQGAAVAAAAIAVGSLRNPLTAWADDDTESEAEHETLTLLRFSTLAGIQKPFLGDAGLSAFRGVHGGGAPWIISEGTGSLRSDGHLKVRVRGLVLDPAFVPAPNGGTNPIPFFMAIVSGFSTNLLNPVNLMTPLFPASKEGDADIKATLTLPHPFYAPIVFVTSLPLGTPAAPRWFAMTGMQ
jgi:hypothetical protein